MPHKRPTLFIDRSLGKHVVADALRKAGASIEIHDIHFPQKTDDDVWLKFIGRKGWVGLTRDQRIRYNPRAKAAIKENKVILVTLVGKTGSGEQWAERFVKALKEIEEVAARATPPALFTFGSNGKLKPVPL
jgi:hypothetical protein